MNALLKRIRADLRRDGFSYVPEFALPEDDGDRLAALASKLGGRSDAGETLIVTEPGRTSEQWIDPFDRAEAIGWHNDFTSHLDRPRLSLAWLVRADPAGALCGAWRMASVSSVLHRLMGSADGIATVRLLRDQPIPFSYSGEGEPVFFQALDAEGPGMLRFYGRGIRQGCRLAWSEVPRSIEAALCSVEKAADDVGHAIAAPAGALLVTDNRRALHDRLQQTVSSPWPLREARLCFVT